MHQNVFTLKGIVAGEATLNLPEASGTLLRQSLNKWGHGHHRLGRWVLAVEDAQGASGQTLLRIGPS